MELGEICFENQNGFIEYNSPDVNYEKETIRKNDSFGEQTNISVAITHL